MNELYKKIEELCLKRGKNITEMCNESGAPRGSLTDLKKGRISSLNVSTLAKISAYFNVPVDFFLDGEETKKAPTDEGERTIGDDEIKFALLGTKEINDDVLDRVKQFAKFAQEEEKSKNT